MAETDLLFGSFVCRRDDRSIRLDLLEGIWSINATRGKDEVIQGMEGKLYLPRIKHELIVPIGGKIIGLGNNKEERWESFNQSMSELKAAFQTDITAVLTVSASYLGISDVLGYHMTARVNSVAWGSIASLPWVQVDIELECIDNPPIWTLDEEEEGG